MELYFPSGVLLARSMPTVVEGVASDGAAAARARLCAVIGSVVAAVEESAGSEIRLELVGGERIAISLLDDSRERERALCA